MSSPTVKAATRCMGLYLLGAGATMCAFNIRDIGNVKKYNLFVNIAASLLLIGCLVMPFATSIFIINPALYEGAVAMAVDMFFYEAASCFLYESIHVRGFAILGDLPIYTGAVWLMRIIIFSSFVSSNALFLTCMVQDAGTSSSKVLANTLYTNDLKLVEAITCLIAFFLYSFIDYVSLQKISQIRSEKMKKKAVGSSRFYIIINLILRMVNVGFKISSIAGNYFPLDYYVYHFELAFNLTQLRYTETLIHKITKSANAGVTSSHNLSTTKGYGSTPKLNESKTAENKSLGGVAVEKSTIKSEN